MVAPYANTAAGTKGTGDIPPVTDVLERINEEFRRRTKTQASLPGKDAVVLQRFGLAGSRQIQLRVLDGYRDLREMKKAAQSHRAGC